MLELVKGINRYRRCHQSRRFRQGNIDQNILESGLQFGVVSGQIVLTIAFIYLGLIVVGGPFMKAPYGRMQDPPIL